MNITRQQVKRGVEIGTSLATGLGGLAVIGMVEVERFFADAVIGPLKTGSFQNYMPHEFQMETNLGMIAAVAGFATTLYLIRFDVRQEFRNIAQNLREMKDDIKSAGKRLLLLQGKRA